MERDTVVKMMDFFKILQIAGYPVCKARKELEDIGRQPDLLAWQLEQRQHLVDFHLQNNPFYRELAQPYSGKWSQLPIITKSHLQGDFREKLPPGIKSYYSAGTSGSSGHPFYFARDKLTHAMVWLNIANCYLSVGIDINHWQARFYGMPLSGRDYYKERIKDRLSHRRRFVIYDLSDEVLRGWLHDFRKRAFIYLYGYTYTLVVFAKYLMEQNRVLKQECPSLELCIVTAEVCSTQDKALLEKGLGVPVYNEYGASETGIIGFGNGNEWQVSDELIHLEVVDDEGHPLPDGKAGRLLCTMLHNHATPLIRYEIGDLATLRHEKGRTFITQLQGRIGDMTLLPSGRKVPGLTFYYVARELLQKAKGIREFRVRQTGPRAFEIELVATETHKEHYQSLLKKGFDHHLEPGLTVSVKMVPSIDRSGSGKFKHFVPFNK